MFDSLRNFFDEMTGGGRPPDGFAEDDHRVAAVALMVHLAEADGILDAPERKRLQRIVEERYALDPATARQLIARASVDEREAVDLFHFTHVLKRRLDEKGRQAVIEQLWDIAYADGQAHELEENIIWRVAELLGVSQRERVELRQRAERNGPEDMTNDGPWGVRGPVS